MACTNSPATAPQQADSARIVVLGDSLTAGPGLRADETMPARLQELVRAAGLPQIVVNAGVSGDTTADAVARLDRALVTGTTVLVVALGANDGLRGVPDGWHPNAAGARIIATNMWPYLEPLLR